MDGKNVVVAQAFHMNGTSPSKEADSAVRDLLEIQSLVLLLFNLPPALGHMHGYLQFIEIVNGKFQYNSI